MEFYTLGNKVTAFTTDRIIGRNRELLLAALPVQATDLVYPHQTHTDCIAVIDERMLAMKAEDRKAQLEGIDAVISDKPGVAIGISTADCIPVLVYDPEHHIAAAIHAGWKGTVKRIVEKTMAEMHRVYATDAFLCTAAIGPGISQDSFEVGQEVVDTFATAGFAMERYTVMMPDMHGANIEKPHIDLKEINRQQLINAGVKASNIIISPIDTFTDLRFYSARREQKPPLADGTVVKCGRILSGFVLS